jgi:translation initiation factor IF-1
VKAPVEMEGVVLEQLPKALYLVELESRHRVTAHLSADVHRNFIRVLPGDRVRIRLSSRDRGRGAIVRRLAGR